MGESYTIKIRAKAVKFIFGDKSDKSGQDEEVVEAREETSETSFELLDDDVSNSPHVMEAKERENNLNILRANASKLIADLSSMEQLISTSENSAMDFLTFIDQNKVSVEKEKRIKIENQRLMARNQELETKAKRDAEKLANNAAEITTLKESNGHSRANLERARMTFAEFKEMNYSLNNEVEDKNREILRLNALNNELVDKQANVESKSQVINEQLMALRQDQDAQNKREADLQKQLVERNVMLEENTNKSRVMTGELESARREVSDLNYELIRLKSDLEETTLEADALKKSREDDQRKFDNRLFNMRSEIDSHVSERRINHQTIHDLKEEIQALRKTAKDADSNAQDFKEELNKSQKMLEQERRQLVEINEKLSSLNLRYNTALTDLKHEQSERRLLQRKVDDYQQEVQQLTEYRDKYDIVSNQLVEFKSLVAEYQEFLENRNLISDDQMPSRRAPEDTASDLSDIEVENKTIQ